MDKRTFLKKSVLGFAAAVVSAPVLVEAAGRVGTSPNVWNHSGEIETIIIHTDGCVGLGGVNPSQPLCISGTDSDGFPIFCHGCNEYHGLYNTEDEETRFSEKPSSDIGEHCSGSNIRSVG